MYKWYDYGGDWPDGRRSGSRSAAAVFDREVEGFGEVFRMLSFEEMALPRCNLVR